MQLFKHALNYLTRKKVFVYIVPIVSIRIGVGSIEPSNEIKIWSRIIMYITLYKVLHKFVQ